MSPAQEKRLSLAIVLLTIVAQASVLWPEIYTAPNRNTDSINHYTFTKQMVDAMEHGGNPLDFWSPEISMGVPMARTYQPLAHLLLAAAYFVMGKAVPLMTILTWARFLAALVLPLSFYACMLMLEFPPLTAAAGAVLLPMIAGPGQGGMGTEIRTWVSFGIYPQEIATNLLLLSIGLCFRAIRTGKRIALAGFVLGLTCLAHLMYGWMGAVCACGMALLPDASAARAARIRRTIALGAVAAVLTFFELVPLFTDGYLINRARFEPAEKFDSYGASKVLSWLFSGAIMDNDRTPALTLLCAAGVALLVWRWWKTRKLAQGEWFALAGFFFWLLIFFGRSTWGLLLLLLGIGADFHLHRLLAVVQIFFLALGAIALAALWRETTRRWNVVGAALLTALLLAPMVAERIKFLNWHEGQGWETVDAVNKELPILNQAISAALQRGGRVYAGSPSTWENAFRIGYTPVSTFMLLRVAPSISFAYNTSVFPADAMVHFDENKPIQYRLFNVRTVIAPKLETIPPFLTPVALYGRFQLLNAPGEGYFGLVDVGAAATVTRDTVDDVTEPWLKSDWLDKDEYIWLDLDGSAPRDLPRVSPGGAVPPVSMPSPPGTVNKEHQSGQVYEADFDAARPAYVLFRMTFHPCWKVTIDGAPQKTAMLTPGFLGVATPAGKHHIVCRYDPGFAKLWMSFAGVLLTAVLFATERVWGRTSLFVACPRRKAAR
jgi:hypothetical protein